MILNLLDRMKLPFRKNKEFLKALYDILGFYPHDIEIYRIAFSHKSLSYRRDRNTNDKRGSNRDKRNKPEAPTKPLNNERLEYLGDAVLETVVSDILFRHFSTKREGFLTSTRSKIVQREALNRLATQMGLETLIQAAQGTRMVHTNIGGNAFEALMGAIYLDRGFKYCHWFIENRVIGHYVDLESVAQKEVNFKSKLLEWCQKNRINTNFRDSANNDSERGFRSTIVLEGITVGKGTGRSKKESQQVASKDALTRMRKEQKLYDSIFRAKEKRTAMEADESFALPKIDEIENIISKSEGKRKPVLEGKPSEADADEMQQLMDSAYDEAYNEKAEFEVIGNAEEESEYSEYATDIQPDATAEEVEHSARTQPTAVLPEKNTEEERPAPMSKAQRRRERNRSAKTVEDAVKGGSRRTKAQKQEETPAEKQQPTTQPAAEKQKKTGEKPVQLTENERQQRGERRKDRNPKDTQKVSEGEKYQVQKSQIPAELTFPAHEKMEDTETDELITLQATILEDTSASTPAHDEIVVSHAITGPEEASDEVSSTVQTESPAEEAPDETNPEENSQSTESITAARNLVESMRNALESTQANSLKDILPLTEIPAESEVGEEVATGTMASTGKLHTEETPATAPVEGAEDYQEYMTPDEAAEAQEPSETEADSEGHEQADATEVAEASLTVEAPHREEESTQPELSLEEVETEEEETEEDVAEEEKELTKPVKDNDSVRPILRHLTLDDFVFGTTDATLTDVEEMASEEDTMDSPLANRPKKKPRRKRRKPQSTEEMHENAAEESLAQEQQPAQPQQPKRKTQRKRQDKSNAKPGSQQPQDQKPAAAETQAENAEKLAKRRAAQRRRRRREHGNGNEASSPSSDN